MKDFFKKVNDVQVGVKAPKTQLNNFSGYAYRKVEDITEAVKPLLKDSGLALLMSDEVVAIGAALFVKATATLTDGEHSVSSVGFAKHANMKKGMDESQLTGSCSSYARKYALGGLLLLDDNKDIDDESYPRDNQNPRQPKSYLTNAQKSYKSIPQQNSELASLKKQVADFFAAQGFDGNKMREILTADNMINSNDVGAWANYLNYLKGQQNG